jgi:glucosamine-6-phosphate deaminase
MKLISCQSTDEVASKAMGELRRVDESANEALRVFVPTGSTPKPLYALLRDEKKYWSKKLSPIQIDEFADSRRLFGRELEDLLIKPLSLENDAKMINPGWSDQQMISHVEGVLSRGVDVAVLGLGPNGHVGFHEPGYPALFTGGRVTITSETKNRVKGATTDQALTFGAGAFIQAREIFLLVTGSGKKEILRKIFEADPQSTELPAAFLKTHRRLTVITDQQ